MLIILDKFYIVLQLDKISNLGQIWIKQILFAYPVYLYFVDYYCKRISFSFYYNKFLLNSGKIINFFFCLLN